MNAYEKQGKKVKKSYDLTNWRWIEIKTDTVSIFVSFQPLDKDINSSNKHALFDRIGISWYFEKYDEKEMSDNMIITDIELPFNEAKMDKILKIIMFISENGNKLTKRKLKAMIRGLE